MGVFSRNSLDNLADVQVEAAVGYEDVTGVQVAMIESYQNQMAIFEGAIQNDMHETILSLDESVDESQVQAFSESALGDLVGKIKAFFVKLWEKIKGIFRSFMAKFDSVFMKSNKEFVNKYRKEVFGKDLTNMKVKLRPRSNGHIAEFPNIGGSASPGTIDIAAGDIAKLVSDFDQSDYICNILNATISPKLNLDKPGDYDKEAMDALYDEAEEVEKIDINGVATALTASTDAMKSLKKANDSLNKALAAIVKDLGKEQVELTKKFPVAGQDRTEFKRTSHTVNKDQDGRDSHSSMDMHASGTKDDLTRYQKAVHLASMQASAFQSAALKYTAFTIKQAKFENAQNRRVYAAAVSYHRKKDESVMMEAMMELADYEADIVYGE